MRLVSMWMCCGFALVGFVPKAAEAQYAAQVLSYSQGATPVPGFTNPSAAIGSPERFSGEGSMFPSVVSPFSPPFLTSEVVSVGEGGHLTLRLSHYALPQASEPEIGIFTTVGLIDVEYPHGDAGSDAITFVRIDRALVEVSEFGIDWTSLGVVDFDVPMNGYIDLTDPFAGAPGSVPSDFRQPFVGSLDSFDGLKYFDAGGGPDMLDLLAGSGGGKWIDISASGLAKIGFLRFSVADDLNTGIGLNLDLDAVSISHAALGDVTVPEPAAMVLVGIVLAGLARRRQRMHLRPHSPAVRGQVPTTRM